MKSEKATLAGLQWMILASITTSLKRTVQVSIGYCRSQHSACSGRESFYFTVFVMLT